MVDWHVHSNPVVNQMNTNVSIIKKDASGRTYEIQLCPTISLSVWLPEKEAKRGNHHIFGVIQVNDGNDFDAVWNAIADLLQKRKDFTLLKK